MIYESTTTRVYEFTAEQIAQINGLGPFSRYGAMLGGVAPSPDLPLTYESLVEQYEEQAKYASRVFGLEEVHWRALAEMWAGTDISIFQLVDVKEAIRADIKKG